MINWKEWEDADAHADVLAFKGPDGNVVELDRRRIIRVEKFWNDPAHPMSQDKASPLTVTYKPAVWSIDEGDEPHPATADINSDFMEFGHWSGHEIREIELKAA
jgi:hypothetical protein